MSTSLKENGVDKMSGKFRRQHSDPVVKQPLHQVTQQTSREDSVNELLDLLRGQEETLDETLLNETKCLLSLSLDRNTLPPLPSIARRKKENEETEEKGIKKDKKTSRQSSTENNSSDEEVGNASLSSTCTPASKTVQEGEVNLSRRRLPALDCRYENDKPKDKA